MNSKKPSSKKVQQYPTNCKIRRAIMDGEMKTDGIILASEISGLRLLNAALNAWSARQAAGIACL